MQKVAEKNGFRLVRKVKIDELAATLFELRHEKTGAKLIYIDRDDDNKTFSIAFPTPPEDSTGVFHIIEHSVLCGSEKYPLKDPFAELLKGSLNTFLNALTYEDRTVYPVSSRCERDFLNLVDVYLDAVFFPKLLENPAIFMQEGWHYEYDAESNSLSYNGVVYNEMKGAYSSADEIGGMALSRALYSDSIYGHDSGGNPECIPSLTYEKFKATHEKYYHPSSAHIILDGKMDLGAVLALIDERISRFEKREATVLERTIKPKIPPVEYVKYEISENEEEKGRARVLFGFVYSDFSDKEAQVSATILSELLCGSNASPLKRALLDRGLCEDAIIYASKAEKQTVILEIRDTDADKLPEIEKTAEEVIRGLTENGIDKEMLASIISTIEFKTKEKDFGTLPAGIAYALSIYGSWIYGGAPEDALFALEVIDSLKKKAEGDYFERTLVDMTLDNPHKACVVMLPDKTLGEQSAREEKEQLDKILASLSHEELERIVSEEKELRAWQSEAESEEAKKALPSLSLSDIPTDFARSKVEKTTENGVETVRVYTKTNGIVYISALFDLSSLAGDDLTALSILASCFTNFPTKNYDALSLQRRIKANLGSFFVSVAAAEKNGIATPYIKIGASALTSKCDELIETIREVALSTRLDDARELTSIVMQAKSQIEDALIASGESIALSRVEASLSALGSISEYLTGYEAYRVLSAYAKNEGGISALLGRLSELLPFIFNKKKMTLILGGECESTLAKEIISIFPEGNDTAPSATDICAEQSEFFVVPAKISHAALASRSDKVAKNLGLMRVVRSILSYEYLWSTVRVKNGAYGTGFIPRRNGFMAFYSYRDPSPAGSIGYFKASPDYLRELAESGEDLTKFIIGAIGEYDTLLTPRTEFAIATRDYLNGWSIEDESRVRQDMLRVTEKDLYTAADIIEDTLKNASLAIVGNAEHLTALDGQISKVIKI